ncbi:curli production assembly/transport protein CsgE [Spirosoma oryzicola]|uniref:curli production assembly/transport protein CsgE n=1 Tax=Spirosoma oryzicola TaxID=2898794 RepID=UPI001E2C2E2A|nr:curli production assembly/transport protein CsgE [Spirosoma oryzicola]UHG94806.1 curli production assembly/transport protein CsgE [Spirosoma oryzicola]
MRWLIFLLTSGLLLSYGGYAQDPDLEGRLEEAVMDETVVEQEGTQTLMLDQTRSKIGRDFYEAFFRRYAELPKVVSQPVSTDTTRRINPNLELDLTAFVVTIDELPAFGVGTTVIVVSLNDQVLWQNYVQARADILEAYAFDAAELINQYVINYQEVQNQLENADQRGTGIF